jgi:uncharacterized protein YbaR (Trm112 family)
MAQLYVCPCCRGQGLLHDMRGEEDAILECMECSASGRVTRRHRDELLEWQHRCRRRPVAVVTAGAVRPGRRR